MKKAEKADKAAEIAYLEKKKELEVKKFFFKNFFSFKSQNKRPKTKVFL